MSRHLSESEFSDYLLGIAGAETHAHLRTCDACRQEMESFGSALVAFNQASLTYSREQLAARPVVSQAMAARTSTPTRHAGLHTALVTGWGLGVVAAAVLAFAVALPTLLHHPASGPAVAANIAAPTTETSPSQPAVDDPAQINADNQMMAAIETEISQPDVSPLESFTTIRTPSTPAHDDRQTARKKI
jgi:anti-sigma factor RsiW